MGTGSYDAVSAFRDALAKRTVQAAWYATGIAIFDRGQVLDVPFALDNAQLEPRATMDLFIRYAVTDTDDVGMIETVEIAAEYVPPENGTVLADENLDQTITAVYTGP
jgi:hypothetical protein